MSNQMLQSTRDRTLGFIRGYIRRHGFPPSMREIGDGVGLSSLSSVTYQLEKLEDEGKITRNPSIPRSIVIREEVDVGDSGEGFPSVYDVPDRLSPAPEG